MVDETTNKLPPPTLQDYGRALVKRAKRAEAMGLILQMPEGGLPEMLETLVEIYRFYQEDTEWRSQSTH